jgi:hypothetical protein
MMRRRRRAMAWMVTWGYFATATGAAAEVVVPADGYHQSREDAWWTGPMMANSAAALPQGQYLIEPYLYDVHSSHADSFGSLTYVEYGITDRLTAGMIPTLGYTLMANGPGSAGVGTGDLNLLAQYSLTQFRDGSAMPAIALMVQETVPTGRYDQLDHRPADAHGEGSFTTTVQLNTQTYFWVPNGRILRMRFNIGRSVSRSTRVDNVSVYGTPAGFRGYARSGDSFAVNAAWEYSLTQHWVLAFDLAYRHMLGARVHGAISVAGTSMQLIYRARSSESFAFAPAIEYNWRSNLGVLVGVRVFTGGHNNPTTVTPAIALNYVH